MSRKKGGQIEDDTTGLFSNPLSELDDSIVNMEEGKNSEDQETTTPESYPIEIDEEEEDEVFTEPPEDSFKNEDEEDDKERDIENQKGDIEMGYDGGKIKKGGKRTRRSKKAGKKSKKSKKGGKKSKKSKKGGKHRKTRKGGKHRK